MADFRSRSLSLLDRVYDFVGGTRGLSKFDLAGSVQPVSDLSRMAALGSRGQQGIDPGGGYLTLGVTDTHVASGAIRTANDVYALFTSISAFADFNQGGKFDHRLWCIDAYAGTDSGDSGLFVSGAEGLEFPATTPSREVLIRKWDDISVAPKSGGLEGAAQYDSSAGSSVNTGVIPIMPRFLPPGAIWNTFSNLNDAGVFRHFMLFWAGPLGATPPGYY